MVFFSNLFNKKLPVNKENGLVKEILDKLQYSWEVTNSDIIKLDSYVCPSSLNSNFNPFNRHTCPKMTRLFKLIGCRNFESEVQEMDKIQGFYYSPLYSYTEYETVCEDTQYYSLRFSEDILDDLRKLNKQFMELIDIRDTKIERMGTTINNSILVRGNPPNLITRLLHTDKTDLDIGLGYEDLNYAPIQLIVREKDKNKIKSIEGEGFIVYIDNDKIVE